MVTEEVAASLEEMIKARIIEGRYDDPVRLQPSVAAADAGPRGAAELDDTRSKKGLGEIYADEYLSARAPSGAGEGTEPAPSAQSKLQVEARGLFRELCAKLDALSHFHFTPRPQVQEMSVKKDVPALVVEEIGPVAVSGDVPRAAAGEVYASKAAEGTPRV